MGLGRRNARQHETAGFQKNALDTSTFWEFRPQQQVMTVDGVSGIVTAVYDGPVPGFEEYQVTLDNGMGGGSYTASQLTALDHSTASHDHEATGLHLASDDYEELGSILYDRPPLERMTFSAARGDSPFEIRHEEINTGGRKFPRQVDMTAHHPETGEQVGSARYFPPKRKGAPISIDEVKGDAPGAASAMLNEIEARHPGSRTHFMYEVKRNNNNPAVTGHENEDFGKPSDWDTHYPNVADTIHRGIALKLPSYSARVVNSAGNTKEDHLDAIHSEMPTGPNIGTHWTENEHSAQLFAHNAISDYRNTVPVVLHAEKPARKDIETRQPHLYRGGVLPYGNGYAKENEIPVRRGREVKVTGISWKPDAPHPDADENGWLHHTYDESMHHTAAMEDLTDEDTQEAEPELPPCAYCGSNQMEIAGDTGRAQQAKCQVCGGMMSAPYGLQFKPELIGDPSNHPKDDPDPASGGVPGAANMRVPVKRMNDSDYTASLHTASGPTSLDLPGVKGQMDADYQDYLANKHPYTYNDPAHAYPEIGQHLRARGVDTNFGSMDANTARFHDHALSHLHDLYPGVIHRVDSDPNVTLGEEFAHASGGHITFGERAARRPGQQHMHGNVSHMSGHLAAPGALGIAAHEFGHALTHHVGIGNIGISQLASKLHPRVGSGRAVQLASAKISDYARKGGPDELTAEAFADRAVNGSNAAPLSHAIFDKMHELYHDKLRQTGSVHVAEMLDLYHRTSPENAAAIYRDRKMHAKEHTGDTYWSNRREGDAGTGYGEGVVHIRVPDHLAEIDDEFPDGEEHYRVHKDSLRPHHFVEDNHHTANGRDWCTFRREARCFYPGPADANGIRMGTPQDRGPCAWDYWQQQVCPISEPGPMALMQAKGSLGIPELQDADFRFHFTASWSDVRQKARRLRTEGHVNITVATAEGVGGEVKGDHHVYETLLTYVPGTHKVGAWECGCKWAAYAWGRSPAYQRFEGRMCSHALAMQFEAQARGMFGRTVERGTERPKWLRHHTPVVTQYERDTGENLTRRAVPPGNMRRTYEGAAEGAPDPLELQRIVDKVREEHALKHQDDGMYAENNEPLHKSDLYPDEKAGWQFRNNSEPHLTPLEQFGIHDEQDKANRHTDQSHGPVPLTHYRHPAGIEPLHLDEHGNSWRRHYEWESPESRYPKFTGWSGPHSASETIDTHPTWSTSGGYDDKPRQQHMRTMRERMNRVNVLPGETHEEIVRRRNRSLAENGWNVISSLDVEGVYDEDHVLDLVHPPVYAHVLAEIQDPIEAMNFMAILGMSHDASRAVVKDASAELATGELHFEASLRLLAEEREEKRCPDCGSMISVHDEKCPHCHHVFPVHERKQHEGAKENLRNAAQDPPSVSGVALKAADTGRVLMLQRGLGDEKDPAAGTWEFPGGHHEEGDQTSLHAGIREWEEETGHPFPEGGVVHHTWTSPNGVYQGHLVLIPEERAVQFGAGRQVVNPDNPDGDQHEQAAWWDPDHARKNPALRQELRTGTPWKEIKAAGNGKTASAQPEYSVQYDEQGPTFEAHSAGHNVGYLTTHDKGDHVFFDGLYVHPEHRGSGIGRELMNHALDYHHGRQIALKPEPYNEEGLEGSGPSGEQLQRFYSGFGFKSAGEYMTRMAATADPLYGLEESSPMSPPQHSNSTNPASSGWATTQDPTSWDDPENNATNFGALPGDGFLGSLHDEPEPALPSTDGAESDLADERDEADPSQYDENDAEATPNTTLASAGSTQDIVARFQATAAAAALGGGDSNGGHHAAQQANNKEIANAARQFLSKQALKDFNFAEQQELINEGARDKAMARNSDVLNIQDTHYAALEAALSAEDALEHPEELFA